MSTRLLVVVALAAWHPGRARAASFTVTNTNDAGAGSLRQAIKDANTVQGSNTIVITATGTINLAAPLDTLSFTLTVTGPGAAQLTIQRAAGTFPILSTSGAVQISGVTVKDGANNGGGGGGGVVVQAGSLVLADSTVTGNSATLGGGIYANGPLTVRNCTISGNTGFGAISASDTTSVIDSTIADNQGTAIVFAPLVAKTLTIDRSTISGNVATTGIGGIDLQGGTANLSNTTFSGNTGPVGGDLWTDAAGVTLSLVNVTSAGSKAPALLFDHTATVTLRNTLFAGTGARCSAGSRPTSQGHNLSSDATCNLTAATDKPGMDPLLGPLAVNGGATRTHALLAGSPAINAGDATGLEALDQRGMPRVQFAAVDIGALEVPEPAISQQPVAQEFVVGAEFTLRITATNPNSSIPLTFQWRKDGAPIADATTETWTRRDATADDAGMYDVVVTNEGGSLTSAAVAVMVGDGTGGGGCCSAAGGGAWQSAALGLVLVVFLGAARRRRPGGRAR
jgi:predicted outer membrane repeat protein